MPYEPTSRDFLPVQHVRNLISRSATFQSWTGTGSPAAALLRVHSAVITAPLNETRPFAIVDMVEGSQESELLGLGHHKIDGEVSVEFQADVVEANDFDEQLFRFSDLASTVKEEMIADAPTYGFLLQSAVFPEKPFLSPIEDKQSAGAYAFAMMFVRYTDF